jgi:hypothetical protein
MSAGRSSPQLLQVARFTVASSCCSGTMSIPLHAQFTAPEPARAARCSRSQAVTCHVKRKTSGSSPTRGRERNSPRTALEVYPYTESVSTQPHLFAALRVVLSSDRINAYRQSPSDTDLDLLERYFWNMALSEALYPTLQALEVALRNNIHTAAERLYATPDWLTRQPPLLHPSEQDQVVAAVGRLARSAKPVTSGRIMAELNLGFWTSLLDRRYEQRLWPQLLRYVFPNLPRRRRTRHTMSARLSELRRLRNRVFHHEPIWHWQNLPQLHRDLLETIYWLDRAMSSSILLFDRFPAVFTEGRAPYRRQLEQLERSWP